MTNKLPLFIDGNFVDSETSDWIEVLDPSTQKVICQAPCATNNEIDLAINSAKEAFIDWKETPPPERSRVMMKYQELLKQNQNEIAAILSKENGKTLEDAKGDVWRGIEVVEQAANITPLLMGETVENVAREIDSYSYTQPLGVCLGITPFNFPAMIPLWMFPMAIACGNTFILKPSEKDPSCSLKLAELFSEAGLPDGVFNVLNGDKDVVNMILNSEFISSVSFVGSTPVAKYIYETSAKNGKRVQALGGAKNHLIVMPDANLNQAVDGIMGAAYGSAGERCMAVSVAVAVGDIGDKLVDEINNKAQTLKVAPWTDPDAEMGPVISDEHKQKIEKYISLGEKEGATLVLDGRGIKIQGYEDGSFVGPTLFDNVTKEMTIYKEEIFGPVLSVVRAKNYEEAINLVNSHDFGNGTSIYTSDGEVSRHFTTNCKIGMVGVNVPIPVPMAFHSFGGWKNSLFGDHAMHGHEGIRFYTKLKTVTSRWPKSIKDGPEFIMPTN